MRGGDAEAQRYPLVQMVEVLGGGIVDQRPGFVQHTICYRIVLATAPFHGETNVVKQFAPVELVPNRDMEVSGNIHIFEGLRGIHAQIAMFLAWNIRPTVLADQAGADDGNIGILSQQVSQQGFIHGVGDAIVGIDESQVRAPCNGYASVTGCGRPGIALMDHPNSWILVRPSLAEFRATIR